MKTPVHMLLLAVATACSTENPPPQDVSSFADTTSIRLVAPERPPAVDAGGEPDPDTVAGPSIAEEPPAVNRPPNDSRRTAARPSSRAYYTGPRGGCYTYSASGRKRYVDRSFCR